MTDFIIKKLPYNLTSHPGLALVGQYFKRLDIGKSLDREFPISKGGISNSDVLKKPPTTPPKARKSRRSGTPSERDGWLNGPSEPPSGCWAINSGWGSRIQGEARLPMRAVLRLQVCLDGARIDDRR